MAAEKGGMGMPKKAFESEKKTVRTTLGVTLIILFSKLCGFARDIISAGYFGTGMERDAYASAYTLFYVPVLLLSSCITSTVVPLYVSARDRESRLAADRFAANCAAFFALASLVLALIMLLLAEPLVKLVVGGFDPEKQRLTAQLTRIMLPSLPFVILSILFSSVLNANERYKAGQLFGFPLTLCVICATVLFARRYGIRAVAWGVFAAGIIQMLILLPLLGKGILCNFRLNFKDERLRQLLLLALPALLSMAVNELNHVIDKSICSYLEPGDPAAMDYAYRLITFATGVLALPLTTVMFSKISRQAAGQNHEGIVRVLHQASQVLSMILLPVTLVGCVLSVDVIRLAYMHGSFDQHSLVVTSGAFAYYLAGILGFGLRDVFNRAFHARQDTKTPMRVAFLTVVLNIVLNLILSRVMGVNGLALATTISCGLGAVVLAALLRLRLGAFTGGELWRELAKVLAAGALCLGAALILNRIVPGATDKVQTFLRLALITGVSLAIYFAALAAQRVKQLAPLKDMLVERFRGRRA